MSSTKRKIGQVSAVASQKKKQKTTKKEAPVAVQPPVRLDSLVVETAAKVRSHDTYFVWARDRRGKKVTRVVRPYPLLHPRLVADLRALDRIKEYLGMVSVRARVRYDEDGGAWLVTRMVGGDAPPPKWPMRWNQPSGESLVDLSKSGCRALSLVGTGLTDTDRAALSLPRFWTDLWCCVLWRLVIGCDRTDVSHLFWLPAEKRVVSLCEWTMRETTTTPTLWTTATPPSFVRGHQWDNARFLRQVDEWDAKLADSDNDTVLRVRRQLARVRFFFAM